MFLNAKNGTVRLKDGSMDYICFGSGERTLIMLPGLGESLRSMKGGALPMALVYRCFAKDFTVYSFSRKYPLSEGCTTRDLAADQIEAMDALGRALRYWESAEALDAETGKFRGLTAGGHTVDYGAGADAVLSERDGHYHLEISAERGAPGENGRDAAVITLGPAQYAFHLENGHLILEYGDDGIPRFSIDEQGHLIMEYDGDIPAPQPGGGMGAAIFGTAVFG